MIKSQKGSIFFSAINSTMFVLGLLLTLTSLNACVTSPTAPTAPPLYKSYGFDSNEDVIRASSVPILINALSDGEWNIRLAAAQFLGKIGPEAKEAVPALVNALGDSDRWVRIDVALALGEIGSESKEVVPALMKALGDNNPSVRIAAARALGKIGPEAKEVVPVLINALSDGEWNIRLAAAQFLGKIGPEAKEAVPALVNALGDSDRWVRIDVALALGEIGSESKEVVPALMKALGDNNPSVRIAAARALGKIGPEAKEAVPALVNALGDNYEGVREAADLAIVKVVPETTYLVPALINALGDSDAMVRYGAVKTLGKIGPAAESVVPALIAILSDPMPDIRKEAISLLRQIGYAGNDFLETLKKISNKDPDDPVRKLASDTLLKIKFAMLASGKTFEHKSTPTGALPVSEKQKPIFLHKGLAQRWAVVIGISGYQDTRIPPLRYASDDAKAFYKWLISPSGGKYAPANVKLLLDQDGSFRNIRDALFVWLNQVLEEDVVTIYFAGHGSPASPDAPENLFLLPYDVEYDSIGTTGFPMWDIETALKRFIKARKVIVFADACHAGGVGQSFDIGRRAPHRGIKENPISIGLQNLSKVGDGVCIISASDDKQFSQESEKWGGGHGVFTYFLLQGLTGEADYNKDNTVCLGELIPYLSEHVRRATRNAQSPTVAGKFDPALSVGR